jgi:hypothetical protein
VAGIAGVVLSWFFYMKRPDIPQRSSNVSPVSTLLDNKYYMDKINEAVFAAARACWVPACGRVATRLHRRPVRQWLGPRGGWFAAAAAPADRLHLPLRFRDDHRHVGAPDADDHWRDSASDRHQSKENKKWFCLSQSGCRSSSGWWC